MRVGKRSHHSQSSIAHRHAEPRGEHSSKVSELPGEGQPSKKMIARYTWHQESSTNSYLVILQKWINLHEFVILHFQPLSQSYHQFPLQDFWNLRVMYFIWKVKIIIISVRSWRVRLIKAQSHLTWLPPRNVFCTLRYIVASHLQNNFDDIWFFKALKFAN